MRYPFPATLLTWAAASHKRPPQAFIDKQSFSDGQLLTLYVKKDTWESQHLWQFLRYGGMYDLFYMY